MRKILVILCLACLFCGCEADKMKTKVCSYNNSEAMSKVNVIAYYTSEDVPKIVVEMSQRYDDDIVKTLSQEKIVAMVQNSLSTTAGSETQMDIEYDEKKQQVYVKMTMFTEDMSEEHLRTFNLHEMMTIQKFVDCMESLNYKCKDGQE